MSEAPTPVGREESDCPALRCLLPGFELKELNRNSLSFSSLKKQSTYFHLFYFPKDENTFPLWPRPAFRQSLAVDEWKRFRNSAGLHR